MVDDGKVKISFELDQGNFRSVLRETNRDLKGISNASLDFGGSLDLVGLSARSLSLGLVGLGVAGTGALLGLARNAPQTSLAFERIGFAAELAGLKIDASLGPALNRVADVVADFVNSETFDDFVSFLDLLVNEIFPRGFEELGKALESPQTIAKTLTPGGELLFNEELVTRFVDAINDWIDSLLNPPSTSGGGFGGGDEGASGGGGGGAR